MAKDIDIGLPDGGEITVPAWSTEETQKQIYALLKSMEGVDKQTVRKLEEAQRSDDRNSKKEIEALKDLGKDLKEGMQGGFLGNLTKAAGLAGSALGTLAKGTAVVVGGVAALGAGLTAAVAKTADFAMSYSDAIKPLVDSGMAFGNLGKQVDESVLDLTRLGFSADDAAKMLNNSSTAFLRLGNTGLKNFTSTLEAAAKQGAQFGMVQDEATEYLLTELEERARSGLVERMNATQFAALQYGILEDQIKASRRLGKTVDEIADIQKAALGDDRLVGLRQSFNGDKSQNQMINDLIANLSAIPGLSETDIADIIAAEQSGLDIESTEAYSKLVGALSQTPGALEAYTQSIGDSVQALISDNQEGFDAAQAEFAKTTKLTGDSIGDIYERSRSTNKEIANEAKAQLASLQLIAPEILGMYGKMSRFGEVTEEQSKNAGEGLDVNAASEAAAKLQNDIADMSGAVSTQVTRAAQEMTEFMSTLSTTLNKSGIKEGFTELTEIAGNKAVAAIGKMNDSVAGIAENFINISKELQAAFGEGGMFGEGGIADLVTAKIINPLADALISGIGSLFTSPTVIAAAVAGIGALMLAMRTAVAGMPGIGTGGNPDAIMGGDADGKDKDGKGKGKGKLGKLGRIPGLGLLSGALELADLSDDLGQINKDLKSGKIEGYEANIARTAETSEAIGGTAGAAGGAMAGAAVGSVVPIVGTAIGGLIGGAIGWYAGREGARAVGEGLAEAVFTPEHIALQNELAKIEERLGKENNRRTQMQLEARQQQLETELQLLKPIESSSPVNPNNIPIMTNYTRDDEESGEDPETTAKKKQNEQDATDQPKTVDDLVTEAMRDLKLGIEAQNSLLQKIAGNTGKTNKGIGAIADTQ